MNVDTTRLRLSDLIAGVSGLVLLVSLFVPWYHWESLSTEAGGLRNETYNAWQALGLIDAIVALAAIAAIAVAVVRLTRLLPDLPFNPALAALVLGVIAVLLVLYRVLSIPSGLFADAAEIDVDRSVGLFVALAASLGVTLGAWLAWNADGRSTAGPGARRRTEPVPTSDSAA